MPPSLGARFLESSESDILTQTGGRTQQQTAGRTGVWQFRAAPADQEVGLEGWLDSLRVWRRSAETTISPDTDGLLGGRYRGTLSETGTYVGRVKPFVPDEVAEVAGMGTALDDFFPPLPPHPLKVGQAWTDSAGATIRRLPDSAHCPASRCFGSSSRPDARPEALRLRRTRCALELTQVSEEHGTFVWHPVLGLVQRNRRIVIETLVPASRSIRQPVRSKIEQRITVVRDLTVSPEAGGRCSQ